MPRKSSQEEIEQIILNEGWSTSDTYINSNTPLICYCPYGHKQSKLIVKTKTRGLSCLICKEIDQIKYVYKFFRDQGCELLEEDYINCNTKMKFKCNCKNISYKTFRNFMYSKQCKKCSGLETLTYEYVYNFFKEMGYELLDKVYINSKTKMNCICKNNHKIKKSYESLKSDYGCQVCYTNKAGDTARFSFDYVFNYFKEKGFTLLETEYKNTSTPMKAMCHAKNHIVYVLLSTLQRNCGCRKCYLESNCGEGNPRWNPNRTIRQRSIYLNFDIKRLKLLKEDPNYNNYLLSKQKVKNKIIQINEYEVDHIFPKKAFIDNNLDIIYGIKIIKRICNCIENLRIISFKENRNKNGKYNQEEFMTWFKSRPEYPELERMKEDRLVKEYINSR
jgi:hypothetical protein